MQSLEEIPSENELKETVSLSEFHESRMHRLFAKAELRERFQIITKWTMQVAAIVVIATTTLFGSLMFTAADVRAAVYGTIVHWFEDFTVFISDEPSNKFEAMVPEYIPEGYTVSTRSETDTSSLIIYSNKTGDIVHFFAIHFSGSVAISNKDMSYEQVLIKDIVYHVLNGQVKGRLNYVVWDIGGCRYYISARLPVDQLMGVALSVK